MKLNADLSQPAIVDTTALNWVPSPLPGVERRMIERDGEEVARATSLVRYQPDSFFSPHRHSGGEEYYVLEGVFSDESGDYPAGYYVRNPVGSSHKPFTKKGCRIFVKLQQMQADDQTYVATDTLEVNNPQAAGLQMLHKYKSERVFIRSLAKDEHCRETAETGLEILVLSGSVQLTSAQLGITELATEHWIRLPGAQKVEIAAQQPSRLLVKQNHL